MSDFLEAMKAYEKAMKDALGPRFYPPDIERRRKKMARSPFLFLRATCWRWAAQAPGLCPDLMPLPAVPSVGDAHAGNFALWRDEQARLVWGLSDYDEAARLPFALDLVRLCVSVVLADEQASADKVCTAALAGYRAGLDAPGPFVLERDHLWLRDAYAADDHEREAYWAELEAADAEQPDLEFVAALRAALPAPDVAVRFTRRSAGAGSLGRARFAAFGHYRGGPIAVEAKAALPSCWPFGGEPGLAGRMAAGPTRSPDPGLRYGDAAVLRRLAPNSRKLDYDEIHPELRSRLVTAMGTELASVHIASESDAGRLRRALDDMHGDWLATAVDRVSRWTIKEQKAFEKAFSDGALPAEP